MKHSVTENLMMINKIIIFFESMISEDLDYDFFSDKVIYDINYIDESLNKLFDQFVHDSSYYSNDNIIKIYFSCIKRFYKLLGGIAQNKTILESDKRFYTSLVEIKINLEKRIDNIKNYNFRSSIKQFDKQCINEDEYNLLLNDMQ